jgi:GNAT superfamily N-acetyltransferase
MLWSLQSVADLTAEERAAVRALSLAVYPPEAVAAWPGRAIEWEPPPWSVIGWDGDAAACYVGGILRDARWNDRAVRVGGIGSVKTHPAARGRGLASSAIGLALDYFRLHGVDFVLLVCEPHLVAFYEQFGWRTFPGELLVRQHGATVPFTLNRCMTAPGQFTEPLTGTIDLLGPPW